MNRRVLLVLIAALLLAACGGPAAEEATVPAAAPTQPPAAATATLPPPVVSVTTEQPAASAPESAPEPAAPLPARQALLPWPADRFGYGIQSHATVGDPKVTMDVVANQLHMDWLKVQFLWPLVQPNPDQLDWFQYDGIVNDAAEQGLNLMFSVVGAPAWSRAAGNLNGPPDDYALFTDFLTQMVTRYQGKVQAIEVWNEENLDREWQTANGISPEDYVAFLAQAYQAIKGVDPNVIVISGALSPTGSGDWVRWADDFEYLDRALAAGMLEYADCVGVHHNGYNIGPDVAFDQAGSLAEAATALFRGPFDNPHHSWSFKTTLDHYAQQVQAINPAMKLCVTEFGWGSSEGYDAYPTGFEFVNDNSLEEQATFIVDAFNQMHDSGQVWLAFLFNFDFGNKGNGPTDDPVPYSLVDTVGAPRPAFSALANMEKRP